MKKVCPHCFGTGSVADHARLGRLMRKAREAAGLSQAALAKAMGVKASYLCRLEQGKRTWHLCLLNRAFRCMQKNPKKVLAFTGRM